MFHFTMNDKKDISLNLRENMKFEILYYNKKLSYFNLLGNVLTNGKEFWSKNLNFKKCFLGNIFDRVNVMNVHEQ